MSKARIERRTVKDVVKQALHDLQPGAVEGVMAGSFTERPNRPLKEIGFRWTFALRVRHHWPDVKVKEAASWLNDYLPSKFGDPEYDWTPSAAQELADSYVMEFGE